MFFGVEDSLRWIPLLRGGEEGDERVKFTIRARFRGKESTCLKIGTSALLRGGLAVRFPLVLFFTFLPPSPAITVEPFISLSALLSFLWPHSSLSTNLLTSPVSSTAMFKNSNSSCHSNANGRVTSPPLTAPLPRVKMAAMHAPSLVAPIEHAWMQQGQVSTGVCCVLTTA